MSTEIHGMSVEVVTTEIESLASIYNKAIENRKALFEDQMIRIPDQKTWDSLTQDEKIAEWDAEGAVKFAEAKAKRDLKEEIDRINNFFAERDATFQSIRDKHNTAMEAELEEARTEWQAKEDNGYDMNYTTA